MLAVKLVEMGYSSTLRNEEGELPERVLQFIGIGWIGVVGFGLWLFAVGYDMANELGATATEEYSDDELGRISATVDCVEAAGDDYSAQLDCYED